MRERIREEYVKPEVKAVLLTSVDGVADGIPGMNNSVTAPDEGDDVKAFDDDFSDVWDDDIQVSGSSDVWDKAW